MPIGDRLKLARTAVNMTIAEVSKKTGIGESSLSDFENGKREPKVSQLAVLGEAYRRSLNFFLADGDVQEQPVLWRLRPGEQTPLIEREFLQLCEQYRLLEEWNNDFITPRVPKVEAGRNAFGYEDAADLARRVANELNLGDRPAFVLLRVLEEDCGIKIFHRRFSPTGTAACVKSEEIGWAILLNAGNSEARRNFDLAHELFHLLMWERFRGGAPNGIGVSPEHEERLADAFASSLLVPSEALRRAVERKRQSDGKLATADLAEIALQFGVSTEALMWRIHRVYNFGPSREAETKAIILALQSRLKKVMPGTEEIADMPPLPHRYQRLAIEALRKGEMSVGKFMAFMEISRREAMTYMEMEEYAPGDIQLTPA